ncbi:MAG: hypothetical protein ACLTS6_13440 [Anaerobutyricum sp.]
MRMSILNTATTEQMGCGASFFFVYTKSTKFMFLLQGSLKLFAGIIMIIMGVNMLGIFKGLESCLKIIPVSYKNQ